jgi:DinB family protein
MNALLTRWQHSVTQAATELHRLSDAQARRRAAPGKWSVKEIVGHLIDSAANNHRRFVEGQFQDTLVFPGYAQDAWVTGQRYQEAAWPSLVALWAGYNDHLVHVVRTTPPGALEQTRATHNINELGWRPVPRSQPVTLGYVIEDYVAHLEHHLAQARRIITARPSPRAPAHEDRS